MTLFANLDWFLDAGLPDDVDKFLDDPTIRQPPRPPAPLPRTFGVLDVKVWLAWRQEALHFDDLALDPDGAEAIMRSELDFATALKEEFAAEGTPPERRLAITAFREHGPTPLVVPEWGRPTADPNSRDKTIREIYKRRVARIAAERERGIDPDAVDHCKVRLDNLLGWNVGDDIAIIEASPWGRRYIELHNAYPRWYPRKRERYRIRHPERLEPTRKKRPRATRDTPIVPDERPVGEPRYITTTTYLYDVKPSRSPSMGGRGNWHLYRDPSNPSKFRIRPRERS